LLNLRNFPIFSSSSLLRLICSSLSSGIAMFNVPGFSEWNLVYLSFFALTFLTLFLFFLPMVSPAVVMLSEHGKGLYYLCSVYCLLLLTEQHIFNICLLFIPFMVHLPKFRSKVFFAPMAGISDPAFRLLCVEQGAGLVFTELTSIHAVDFKEKLGKKELLEFIPFSEKERPVAVQLFGNDIALTKRAVQALEPYFDIIDFNIGCPAQHITAQMAGAALLQKPEHMEKLLTALISGTDKPVSIKMRAGVGKNNKLFLKIGKLADDVGISMITLHPRTVEQGYSGKSDWSLIRELKEKVNVPVVGNGDIRSPEDAKRMVEETGCDYIMIGRAAAGNPFMFREVNDYLKRGNYEKPEPEEKKKELEKYLELAAKFKVPFPSIRNQAMNFSKGARGGAEIRRRIAISKDEQELRECFGNGG
jgi:tRNA-dihydrouridine synthase B